MFRPEALLPAPLRRAHDALIAAAAALQPLALLAARLYVARVFLLSGLTKLRDWETTVALFTDEYHVPLLSPEVAAVFGTFGETVLPVLLVLGLGGRLAALGLSVVNVVAVLSVPDMPEPAFMGHVFWGSLLAAVVLWGPGRWSVDGWLAGRDSPVVRRG
jgi:putative oxidoreductase